MARKYEFNWSLLGNLQLGRPNLGPSTRVEVYRLMQYCLRDVLEQKYGTQEADQVFYDAGYLAGQQVFNQYLKGATDIDTFVSKLQTLLRELNIGVLRVEEANLEQQHFVLTVAEDLDCSGLPELDFEICIYDEGFIAALFDCFTGKKFKAKEIDCWCTGDRTCRFQVELNA
jgi:uncharacterized protein